MDVSSGNYYVPPNHTKMNEELNKELKRLVQISTLRDVQIELKKAQLEGMVIPEIVFEIIKNLEDSYNPK